MNKIKSSALALMIVIAFAGASALASHTESVEGNVICLIPDYQKGTVKPVIAVEPCDAMPAHAHILVSKEGAVYSLQGLDKGLIKIQQSAERRNVTLTGRVEGNAAKGWILYVN